MKSFKRQAKFSVGIVYFVVSEIFFDLKGEWDMEAFQKANFLRMRLCYIKNDMEKETRGGLSSYQKH